MNGGINPRELERLLGERSPNIEWGVTSMWRRPRKPLYSGSSAASARSRRLTMNASSASISP